MTTWGLKTSLSSTICYRNTKYCDPFYVCLLCNDAFLFNRICWYNFGVLSSHTCLLSSIRVICPRAPSALAPSSPLSHHQGLRRMPTKELGSIIVPLCFPICSMVLLWFLMFPCFPISNHILNIFQVCPTSLPHICMNIC